MMGTEKGVQGGGPPLLFLFLNIYLAVLGLGCSPWAHVPPQGWNPGPLRGECGILASGPPGKSRGFSLITLFCPGNTHVDTVFSYPRSHL